MTSCQNVGAVGFDGFDTGEALAAYAIPRKPTPNLTMEVSRPNGIDDALWAELTPKQKVVVAHRLLCVSEYRKEMV